MRDMHKINKKGRREMEVEEEEEERREHVGQTSRHYFDLASGLGIGRLKGGERKEYGERVGLSEI